MCSASREKYWTSSRDFLPEFPLACSPGKDILSQLSCSMEEREKEYIPLPLQCSLSFPLPLQSSFMAAAFCLLNPLPGMTRTLSRLDSRVKQHQIHLCSVTISLLRFFQLNNSSTVGCSKITIQLYQTCYLGIIYIHYKAVGCLHLQLQTLTTIPENPSVCISGVKQQCVHT